MEYVEDGLPSEDDAGYFGVPSAKPSTDLDENHVGCFDDCCILSADEDDEDSELMTSSTTTPARSPMVKPQNKNKLVDGFEDVDCLEELLPSGRDDPFLSVDTPIPSSSKPKSTPESRAPPSPQATEPVKSLAQGNDTKPKQNYSFTVLNELIDEDYFSTLKPSPSLTSTQKPTREPSISPQLDTLSPSAIQNRLRTTQKPEDFIANVISKITNQNAKKYEGTWLEDAYKPSWEREARGGYLKGLKSVVAGNLRGKERFN